MHGKQKSADTQGSFVHAKLPFFSESMTMVYLSHTIFVGSEEDEDNMKLILWASRHNPIATQHAELRRIFGEHSIALDPRPFDRNNGTRDALARFRSRNHDEIVITAPTTILAGLLANGVTPIWPTMSEDGRRFLGFDRITEIRKTAFPIEPQQPKKFEKILWVSQFCFVERQHTELKRLFGNETTVTWRNIRNAEDLQNEFYSGRYSAVVAVVPEAVFERLSEFSFPLIRAESVPENALAKIEFRGAGGQGFRFHRFVWYRIETIVERL
jgi:hypothetical protein